MLALSVGPATASSELESALAQLIARLTLPSRNWLPALLRFTESIVSAPVDIAEKLGRHGLMYAPSPWGERAYTGICAAGPSETRRRCLLEVKGGEETRLFARI